MPDLLDRSDDDTAVLDAQGHAPETVSGYPDVVEAFREVASAISDEIDLDVLLHMVAKRICSLLEIRRCSVYLKNTETGLFHGQVGETGHNQDAAIKRLTCGVESDGFTREILARKEPVLISNAKSDPRTVKAVMRDWDVRSMLGVPMIHNREVIGLLFLDNADEPRKYSDAEQHLAATFANLMAVAISQAQRTANLAESFKTVARQNKLLRRSTAIEDRLTNLVLDGADMSEIASTVTSLTQKPCAIFDVNFARVAEASPDGKPLPPQVFDADRRDIPVVAEAIAGTKPKRPSVVGPISGAGLPHRFMIAPVTLHDDQWGYLVLTETDSAFSALDMIVARRAATIITLEQSAEHRAAEVAVQARGSLARDLIHGSDDAGSLKKRAGYQGVNPAAPHVVALITRTSGKKRRPPSARRFAVAIQERDPERKSLVCSVADAVAAIVELPTDAPPKEGIASIKSMLRDVADSIDPDEPTSIAISAPCDSIGSFPGAYTQARQVASCAVSFSRDENPTLSADDLGAGRLLLSGSEPEEVERFANDTLGALTDDDPVMATLLATAAAFFEHSGSIRQSAIGLDVHENTIRYRLGRIKELTGLDLIGNADDQLSTQVALLVLRMQGRSPVH